MSVRFRKDRNAWMADFIDPQTGKRIRKLRPTKRLALELEQSFLTPRHPQHRGHDITNPKTIEQALIEYAERNSIKKDSEGTDKRCLRIFAYFFLTEDVLKKEYEFIDEITLEDLELFQQWLQKDHVFRPLETPTGIVQMAPIRSLKSSTINRWFDVYKNFFKACKRWSAITSDPTLALNDLPVDEFLRTTVSKDEFNNALLIAPGWFKPVFEFLYIYGCRPSSIERLEVSHVDFQRNEFKLSTKKGKHQALRFFSLPMSERSQEILERECTAKIGKTNVFLDQFGNPITASRISKEASKIFKSLGLPHTAYSLRNSIVEDALLKGIPMEQVRRIVGHASIKTTQTYAKQIGVSEIGNSLKLVR